MPEMPDFAMSIGETIIRSVSSLIVLFLLSKMVGARQIAQMTFADYIAGISIGSIAATMALDNEIPFYQPTLAMLIYAAFTVMSAIASTKSIKARRLLTGTPLIMIYQGKLIEAHLAKAHMDVNDIISQARVQGYFNLSDIEYAVLETTGQIAFMPAPGKRPATCEDLGLTPPEQTMTANVILDGRVMHENLVAQGFDETWLRRQLAAQGFGSPERVLLASCDRGGTLRIYTKGEAMPTHTPFI